MIQACSVVHDVDCVYMYNSWPWSWLPQLHLFRGFYSSPHNAASVFRVEMALKLPVLVVSVGICSEVSIVAHIMQCICSEVSIESASIQRVQRFLLRVHLFRGFRGFYCSPHHAMHLFRSVYSSPHNAVHLFRSFYISLHHAARVFVVEMTITFLKTQKGVMSIL